MHTRFFFASKVVKHFFPVETGRSRTFSCGEMAQPGHCRLARQTTRMKVVHGSESGGLEEQLQREEAHDERRPLGSACSFFFFFVDAA